MGARANSMLAALQPHGTLPLSALICSPPHEPFEGDLQLDPEFAELQSRYMALELLVSHTLVYCHIAVIMRCHHQCLPVAKQNLLNPTCSMLDMDDTLLGATSHLSYINASAAHAESTQSGACGPAFGLLWRLDTSEGDLHHDCTWYQPPSRQRQDEEKLLCLSHFWWAR